MGASYRSGYLFQHDEDAGRPNFDGVPTPDPMTLVAPATTSGPQDQWGIAPQTLGNVELMSIIRVPIGASCVIAATSHAGISGYALDRKNGDLQQQGRMGAARPVPLQPYRQKAGTSVESGAGTVGPYGVRVPAVIEVTASPVNRDFVIIGGADLFVEVYTDSRPQQEIAVPTSPFVIAEQLVTDGVPPSPGLPFNFITVSPVLGANPWFAPTSYRMSVDPAGTVRPYLNTLGRGTVNGTGEPDFQRAYVRASSLPHRLITHLLNESEAPYYSAKFAIVGMAYVPDAAFVYANAAVAPTTAIRAESLFIKDQPTYNPGPSTTFSPTYGIAALGAAS